MQTIKIKIVRNAIKMSLVKARPLKIAIKSMNVYNGQGDIKPYEHIQSAPSTEWTINHNLGRYPGAVTVIDSAGTVVLGSINYISETQIILHFSVPFGGTAYLV